MAGTRKRRGEDLPLRKYEQAQTKRQKRKEVTFEELIDTNLRGHTPQLVYSFICEAMDIPNPSPTFLMQITSELRCDPIDWFEYLRIKASNDGTEDKILMEPKSSEVPTNLTGFVPTSSQHECYGHNAQMRGAVHPNDVLLEIPENDALDCPDDPNSLAKFMPIFLVNKARLWDFRLFKDPSAYRQIPSDFMIPVKGLCWAKAEAESNLAASRSHQADADLDVLTLRALALYGGHFPQSGLCDDQIRQVWFPSDLVPYVNYRPRPLAVNEYWRWLKDHEVLWDEATYFAKRRATDRKGKAKDEEKGKDKKNNRNYS